MFLRSAVKGIDLGSHFKSSMDDPGAAKLNEED